MIQVHDAFAASFIVLASYAFWMSHVPPTPPASKTETKRPIPWIRIHAVVLAMIDCTSMLLSAYRALLNGSTTSPLFLNHICHTSMLHSSPGVPWLAFIGYSLILIGGYIRIAAQRTLGKFFTWEIALKPDHKLCTVGPYAVVRHPGYLGLWTLRIGIDIVHSSSGTVLRDCLYPRYPLLVNLLTLEGYLFTMALIIWMSFRAKWEDDLMKKEFKGAWNNWAEKTPYRVFPYIY